MMDTEQKILDAALKVFARKGYDAATTRVIAEESGFTEMTLFRKFQTKKNLFEQVMNMGNQEIQKNSQVLFEQKKYKNNRDLLLSFVKNLDGFINENFEFFHLSIVEDSKTVKPVVGLIIDEIGRYVEKNLPNKEIDYNTFGFSIATYIYSLNIDRYYGRTASFDDYQKSLEQLVDVLYCILEA